MMKQYLIGLLLCLTLGSCLTTARINRNRAEILSVLGAQNSTTTYKDTTIYLNDTIEVALPQDTVTLRDTIQVWNGVASIKPKTVKNGIVSATAWITNNRLNVTAWINQPNLNVARTDTITITKVVTETNTVTTVVEKKIPDAYKWSLRIMLFEILIVIGWMLFKFNVFGAATSFAKLASKFF